MRQPIVRGSRRNEDKQRDKERTGGPTHVHAPNVASIRRNRYRRTASLRGAAGRDVRAVRTSAAGLTGRPRSANANASFEGVLVIMVGAAGLEIVAVSAENTTAPVPVVVTEIATLAPAVAPALSLTVTEMV